MDVQLWRRDCSTLVSTCQQMYIPAKYLVEEWAPQEELILENPLATIVTHTEEDGLIANHIPMILRVDAATGRKYICAHIARVNHQVPSLSDNPDVLVIFKSPDSYITPTYYPTKQETHKVVPTWDFAAVHIKGKSRIVDEPSWVLEQLNDLTDQQERNSNPAWRVDETPSNYLGLLQKAIYGLEIEIVETRCKFKFEQQMKRQDIDGVIDGLERDGKVHVSNLVRSSNA